MIVYSHDYSRKYYPPAPVIEMAVRDVRIGPHLIRGIKAVAAVGQQETLLGRDVLNNLIVTLNGLASVTEVEG